MKALTIWQPWASLIAAGFKPYEYRRWPAPGFVRGQRIVIHAAKRPLDIQSIPPIFTAWQRDAIDGRNIAGGCALLDDVLRGIVELPFGAGIATGVLGRPRRATELFSGADDPDSIDPAAWAWPIGDVRPFPQPIPARGAQGFWDWREAPI